VLEDKPRLEPRALGLCSKLLAGVADDVLRNVDDE
jgi:hypothetical protein